MNRPLPLFLMSMMMLPLMPLTAKAQDGNGLNLPPEGQTIINFSATETKTVPQDLLIASLRIEIDDADPVVVQKKINEAMVKALAVAKKDAALKVSTGGYTVYKYDEPIDPARAEGGKTKTFWRGSQSIDLRSRESSKILDIVGKIQGMGFAMNDLTYTLAPETVEKVRDELLVLALKKLQDKAAVVSKTLGKANYDLVDVNVDTGGPVMPMFKGNMMRAESAAMSDAMPAPVAEAGETDVSLSVSARALIKP